MSARTGRKHCWNLNAIGLCGFRLTTIAADRIDFDVSTICFIIKCAANRGRAILVRRTGGRQMYAVTVTGRPFVTEYKDRVGHVVP